jgi:hypothetical protein
MTGKMVPILVRAMGRTTNVYHFIIICLMFEPFKKSEDNFIINKNIKILKRLWEKIILFSLN